MSKQTCSRHAEAERLADELAGVAKYAGSENWETLADAAAELRRLVSFNKDLMDEVAEQCRINGMSAEREDALRAEVERLNKAVAGEREACAKVADGWSKRDDDVGAFIGKAIRARGNT